MTTVPTPTRRHRPTSLLLCGAVMALSFGVACANLSNEELDSLALLIGVFNIGGAITTLVLASNRGAMSLGVVLWSFFFWPVGLYQVISKTKKQQ